MGLGNERHFVLFMGFLVVGCSFFVVLGKPHIVQAMWFEGWSYIVPGTCFVLVYILAVALAFAVGVMLLWQLYLISRGETTVENYDNARYVEVAKRRGTEFINCYDLGYPKNLALFFNIGPQGYTPWTLILPVRCMPYTDGWSWARRPGMVRHQGVDTDDELTDDE